MSKARQVPKTELTRNPNVFEEARLDRTPLVVKSYNSSVAVILPIPANVSPDAAAAMAEELYEVLGRGVAAYVEGERVKARAALVAAAQRRGQPRENEEVTL